MAANLDALRKEYVDLGARTARFAITSAIVLTIGCLTFARALRTLNTEDMATTVNEIYRLAEKTNEPPRVPAWARFVRSIERADPADTGDLLARKHELEEKLQRDAEQALMLDLSMVGTKFQLNLQYWSLLIPFVLCWSLLYLQINAAKIEAVRRLGVAALENDPSATAVDKLTFRASGPTPFVSYPSRIGVVAWFVVVAALLVTLFTAALLNGSDLIFIAADSLRWLAVMVFYTVMIGRGIRRRLLGDAALLGAPAETKERFVKLRNRMTRVREAVRRRWRLAAGGGSLMTLASLFLMTAISTEACDGERTGADLLLGRKNALWTAYDTELPIYFFRIEALGRIGYTLMIVAAAAALLYAIATLARPLAALVARRQRLRDLVRGLAVISFFFVVCEFGFVEALLGLPDLMPPVFELIYWIVPSILYLATTVVGPQRWRRVWDERLGPVVRVAYAPAVLFAPWWVLLYSSDLPGLPLAVGGTALVAAGLALEPSPAASEQESPIPPATRLVESPSS